MLNRVCVYKLFIYEGLDGVYQLANFGHIFYEMILSLSQFQ